MSYPKPYWSQILGTQASGRSALGLSAVASSGSYADLSNTPLFGALALANGVTLAQLPAVASNTIFGNATGGVATPTALTAAQTKTLLAIAASDVSGLGALATLSDAPAGTLTGVALNAAVVSSSLTSVGALASGSAVSGFTVADACLTSNVVLKNGNNTFTGQHYVTGTNGMNIGSATAPKGTGVAGSKLEVQGTGAGSTAFGSIAISRADGTSASVVGSIDFYAVTTLSARIICNQISGGPGGVNTISFNLGSAGTMTAVATISWTSGTLIGKFTMGAFNGTYHGQIQLNNYFPSANGSALVLATGSAGSPTSMSVDWVEGAGNTFSRIRGAYAGVASTGDIVFSVGTGASGLQDFVRLTTGSRMDFYLLDASLNQKVGGIYPQWQNSVDATRAGQINFTAMNTTNENIAFYYWADSASSTRMVFNANTISFNGTGKPNFAVGLQLPSTSSVLFNSVAATSGTTLTNSGDVRFNTTFWNGASSAGQIGSLLSRAAYVSQGSVCLAYQCNAGGGASDLFSVGAATTGAEASSLTVGNVIVSGALSYPTFSINTSWSSNVVASRTALASIGVYYITTFQSAISIQANSGGNAMIGFYGVSPVLRQTLPSSGTVVASDIRTALINLGLCQ